MNDAWSELRNWDPDAVDDAAHLVRLRVDELGQLADTLNWQHPAGSPARRPTGPARSGCAWWTSSTSWVTRPTR